MVHLKIAANRLFANNKEHRTTNFKFTPGSDREINPEKIAQEINKALSQIKSGDAKTVTF